MTRRPFIRYFPGFHAGHAAILLCVSALSITVVAADRWIQLLPLAVLAHAGWRGVSR